MAIVRLLGHWKAARVGLMVVMLASLVGCDSAKDRAGDPGGSDQTRNTARRTGAVTVASILENPSVYYKQPLAVPGYIKEILGPNSMVIQDTPDAGAGNELLVINQAQGQVTFADKKPGDPIFVQGMLQPFGEVQAQLDPPDAQQRFTDRPALLATVVVDSEGGSSGSGATPTP